MKTLSRGRTRMPRAAAMAAALTLMAPQMGWTSPKDWELAFELSSGSAVNAPWRAGARELSARAQQAGTPGIWTSPAIEAAVPFSAAVVSWNARTPPGTRLRVEARAFREGGWSPWCRLATWSGDAPEAPIRRRPPPWAEPSGQGVRLDVDTLLARPPGATALQCRLSFFGSPAGPRPRVRALCAVLTATGAAQGRAETATDLAPIELDVPYRSQRAEERSIASRICCPTSLSMAMAWLGKALPTKSVALRCYDPAHDLFGNWSFAAAAAGELGFDARVTRLRDWAAVRRYLERGVPVIVSIGFEAGGLDGSPMKNGTAGHLILVRGFTSDGRVLVNDPAGADAVTGQLAYRADQLLAAWRNGAAIVVEPPADR
ncbi:MAG: C39 family peptidase [Candidatus Wallbacteria bacterium]|nr:C39 family peptidase [Candidatus Wallbacteria bacterium]